MNKTRRRKAKARRDDRRRAESAMRGLAEHARLYYGGDSPLTYPTDALKQYGRTLQRLWELGAWER